MRKIFLAVIVSIGALSAPAQFTYDYLKGADTYYEKGNYASAAEYYEKYFDKDNGRSGKEFDPYSPQSGTKKTAPALTNQERAVYNLAECYRLLNYPSKAEPYYQKAMTMNKARFPLAQYYYAGVLRALGKYDEAEQNYKSFLDGYLTDDAYHDNAQRELLNIEFIRAQLQKKDLKYYTVTKAPAELNTTGASYAPVWLNSTTLLFTSTRPEDSIGKNKLYTNRVFQAVYSGGNLTDINPASLPQENGIQQGVVSLTPDGNTLFLTRWTINDKIKTSSIYSSKHTTDGWSEPVKLGEAVNTPGFSSQQPFVTADGKYLLYSSNRSGGQGGFDLWYSVLADGEPGPSVNMGNAVNTTYDEQAPFYHEASKSLIFSSNGRIGMGGYDFFQSKGAVDNPGTPVNMGYPVNSIKDDIYFTSRGSAKNILEDVILSSDREAVCCLELFYLKKIRPLRSINGQVVSCDPSRSLAGATVSVVDTISNKIIYTKMVGADGIYSFPLEEYQPLTVKATAEGFISRSLAFNAPEDPESETMTNPVICLVPELPKVSEALVVQNVYYDFDKAELKAGSDQALDELVKMMETYPDIAIEISAYTDSKGSAAYNQQLSAARAQNVVAYLISKGISEARLKAKGYGESMPVAPNTDPGGKDNPEGREKNRRTEFKVLKSE